MSNYDEEGMLLVLLTLIMMLHNAHTTELHLYVTVISCDLGVACFSVCSSQVGCAGEMHLHVRTAKHYAMFCACVRACARMCVCVRVCLCVCVCVW